MWVPEGRITLTPRRQGSPGRPAPALGWQRTPVLPPQGENWAQAGEWRQLLHGARGSQSPPCFLHLPQLTPPCLASHLCSEATKDSAQPRSQAQPPPPPPHTPSVLPKPLAIQARLLSTAPELQAALPLLSLLPSKVAGAGSPMPCASRGSLGPAWPEPDNSLLN